MKHAWLLFLFLVPALASAQINSLPSQPHLLVKGEATKTVVPDQFAISLVLNSVNLEPELAREQVEQNASAVLASMKKQGAVKGSIDASTLSMSSEERYEDGKRVFKGTRVGRTLRAQFDDPIKLQGFLASLKTSEELQIDQLKASYSKEDQLRAELKREAAQQSRDSAEGLARAYGSKIVGLYTISDVAPSFAYGVEAGVWPESGHANRSGDSVPSPPAPPPPPSPAMDNFGTSLSAGNITITENVYAVFLIAQ